MARMTALVMHCTLQRTQGRLRGVTGWIPEAAR
jgi:hypothetical protein